MSWHRRGKASQPRILPKPAGSHKEVCLLEPGSWKCAALCSGFDNKKTTKNMTARMMGLAYKLFSMQSACFASIDAGKLFRSPLFPRSLAELGFASQAALSQWEDTGGVAHPPPAAAVLVELLPPPGPIGPLTCFLQNLLFKPLIVSIFTLL